MNKFYREYLDTALERRGTHCVKWDNMKADFGRDDLIPAGVADMDFCTAPAVHKALMERAAHAIYGYTSNGKAERAAEAGWLKRRHGCEIEEDWILFSPGVIDSQYFCVRALTEEKDKIYIQTPVYGSFYGAINTFGRTMVKSPLIETDDGWRMDFEDMEKQFADGVKMMILCSPHNPLGRVWTKEELERVLELANRYGVILMVDEIHADFVFAGHKQHRILSLENSGKCIMLTSATKSFNLAGLRTSSCIIPDAEMRRKVAAEMERAHAGSPNMFGAIAQMAAYSEGDEWMDAVVEYIQENRDYVVNYLRENLPEIKVSPLQGTYLMWFDCRALGLSQAELKDLFVNGARVGVIDGTGFGPEGEGRLRVNIATQHSNVVQMMENIKNTIRSR